MAKSAARIPGVAFLIVLLGITFSTFATGFASLPNLLNIGIQSSTLLLLALPMTFVIMTEGLDLSMGAFLGLTGVVPPSALVRGESLGVAVAVTVEVGRAFGLTNGLMVVKLERPTLVTTL